MHGSEACGTFMRSRLKGLNRMDSNYMDIEERTRLADVELEAWQEQLVLAKQQRNLIRGACSLPPEVLVYIFLILRDSWCPTGNIEEVPEDEVPDAALTIYQGVSTQTYYAAQYTLGWMTVLSVSNIWRRVSRVDLASEPPCSW